MFKLKAHGTIATVVYPRLVVMVVHHQQGHANPVVLECELPHTLRDVSMELAEGDPIWLEGNAYQKRQDPARPTLAVNVTHLARPQPSLLVGRGSMSATVHGRVHSEIESGVVESGPRAGCEFMRFSLHVNVPEMPQKHNVVLRIKGWDGESSWIAHNHQRGDRITLEGDIFELRFTGRGGVNRVAHQLLVREWWWGKSRDTPATVVSERVTSRPVQGAPQVIRRGKV